MPVLIILAALWAVVLVPPLLRSRSQRTADSIVDFNYKLDVLGRTNGHVDGVVAPVPAPRLPAGGASPTLGGKGGGWPLARAAAPEVQESPPPVDFVLWVR